MGLEGDRHAVRWRGWLCAVAVLVVLAPWPGRAQEETPVAAEPDYGELGLEDLMDIPVSSASRKVEPLLTASAAIYVISGDELRQLGVRSLPEALRLAPGLHVAQIDTHEYGISARGLNRGALSNLLEVLVDGRSIYTPLFSGVSWDQQYIVVEDIERIEVIRGPGGTLWGANAVNGVINVITKPASDTTGVFTKAGGGGETQQHVAVRSGLKLGDATQARVSVQRYGLDDSVLQDGSNAQDGIAAGLVSLRTDTALASGAHLAVTGNVFDGDLRETNREVLVSGHDLNGAWSLADEEAGTDWSARLYYDTYRHDAGLAYLEERETVHAEVQHRRPLFERHDLIAGLSYRSSSDETGTGRAVMFLPARRSLKTYGVFLQDEIVLTPEVWDLTVGAKIENNDFTGTELQPNLRSGYRFSETSFGWAAVSRAVRIPNRVDHDLAVDTAVDADLAQTPFGNVESPQEAEEGCNTAPSTPLTDPFCDFVAPPGGSTVVPAGNRAFKSEELLAYELGYRTALRENLSLDMAAFLHNYDQLRSREVNAEGTNFENRLEGSTRGIETLLRWQLREGLGLHLDYTLLSTDLQRKPGSTDTQGEAAAGNDPSGYGNLRLVWAWRKDVGVETHLRHVAALAHLDIPAYTELNLGAAWIPRPWLAVRVAGRNLLHDRHAEFSPGRITKIERSVEGLLELRLQ